MRGAIEELEITKKKKTFSHEQNKCESTQQKESLTLIGR